MANPRNTIAGVANGVVVWHCVRLVENHAAAILRR